MHSFSRRRRRFVRGVRLWFPVQGTVTVKDGKAQTASRTITIKEWVTLSFPQLTSEPRTIDVGKTTPLAVSGGKAPTP